MNREIAATSSESIDNLILLEIGGVLLLLGIVAFVATKIALSSVPLFLLIGLFFGTGGLVPLNLSGDFLNIGAQMGAILLLLLMGLEYSARELGQSFRSSKSVILLDVLINGLPGILIALLAGWGVKGALLLGGITYVSSSGIASELIRESGWAKSQVAKRTILVLISEDLILAPYLPLITSTLLGVGLLSGIISVSIALLITGFVLLIGVKRANWFSRIFRKFTASSLLLTVFGLALVAAGAAGLAGFSGAIAAFLVGLLLTGEVASAIRTRLAPLRDFFAAIFFIFFGLSVNPARILDVLGLVVVLTIIGIFGKILIGWWIARDLQDPMSWRRVGIFLIPRGEFSVIIAGFSTTLNFSENLKALTIAYVIATTLSASLLLRFFRSGFEKSR
ncbi:MAG: cation:proton antiporter [Actinobacteria bacterium]|nr:cation:proton antiporter [Actinomycetota bacterium]